MEGGDEDGETRRRAIPLSVFILSLNSRPATEANGVLIYSWMTHTSSSELLEQKLSMSDVHLQHTIVYFLYILLRVMTPEFVQVAYLSDIFFKCYLH